MDGGWGLRQRAVEAGHLDFGGLDQEFCFPVVQRSSLVTILFLTQAGAW